MSVDDIVLDRRINGTVTDRVGDAVDGAAVTIYDSDGNVVDEVTTQSDGFWRSTLDTGNYTIQFERNTASDQQEIAFDVDDGAEVDQSLDLYYGSGNLTIVDQLDGTLIDDRYVDITFTHEDSITGVEHSIELSTQDGTFEYSGLVEQFYEAEVSAEGYSTQTIPINDTKETHEVGLLADGSSVTTPIAIDDRTGYFAPADTWVEIRAFDGTEWSVEGGAYLGEENRGEVVWQTNETYRIYAENFAGDEVVLGEYTPSQTDAESDEVLTFVVDSYDAEEGNTTNSDGEESDDPDDWNYGPTAWIDATPGNPVDGETVTFDASNSRDLDGSIASYSWEIDGNSYSGSSVDFDTTGYGGSTIDANLTVTDDGGETDTIATSVYVGTGSSDRNELPVPEFDYTPTDPSPGERITVDASETVDPNGSVSEYRWDLTGNGEVDATGETVTFDYTEGGIYRVELIVEDSDGALNRTSQNIAVYAEPASGGSGGSGGGGVLGAGASTDGVPSPAGPSDPGVSFALGGLVLAGLVGVRRSSVAVPDYALAGVGALDLVFMADAARQDPLAATAVSVLSGVGLVVYRRYVK